MSFNLAIIYGNLGKDPEIRSTQSGKSVASFSVATQTGWGDNQETFWANIVAFGQQADFASKFLRKGSLVKVIGELKSRKWTGKDGQERTTVEITAKDIGFGESKRSDSGSRAPAQAPRTQTAPPRRDPVAETEIQDSDIPW